MKVVEEKVIQLNYNENDLYNKIILKTLYNIKKQNEFIVDKDNLLIVLGKVLKEIQKLSIQNMNDKLKSLNIKTDNIFLNLNLLKNRNFIYETLKLDNIDFNENFHIKFILDI